MSKNDHEKRDSLQGESEELSCPKCGEKVTQEMKFCPKCGTSLVLAATAPTRRMPEKPPFDLPGLVSFGFFLILVGAIYLGTPDVGGAVISFISDFRLVELSEQPRLVFPAPASNHPVVYGAAEMFCLVFGASQIFVLILRFVFRSSLSEKAETASGVIFWLGVGYVAGLLKTQTLSWFSFLGGVIIFAGLSLVIRSLLDLTLKQLVRSQKP